MPRPRRKAAALRKTADEPARPEPPAAPRARPRRPDPIDPEKYPNLAAHRELERALRIHRAMQAGLTREEAIVHADEHLAGRAGRAPKPVPMGKAPRKIVASATRRRGKS